jgi:type IV secretory pathway TraG/TraD family ATPase VirD4
VKARTDAAPSPGWPEGAVVLGGSVMAALHRSATLLPLASLAAAGGAGAMWWRRLGRSGPLRAGGAGVPRDGRDGRGFASRRQLRREATVPAAARRAAQTRPGLRTRPAPSDVGYPLGRSRPAGLALWPSWEASLRLVAPPGEGKTFRVLAPILRQHPGPALATSTKADLFELTAGARGRQGPVLALDPDRLVPAAEPVRWSPVAGCEVSEVAERRATALMAAVGEEGEGGNGAFFRDSAREVLKCYLHAAGLDGADIRAVLGWSRRPDDPGPGRILSQAPGAAPGWGELLGVHTTGAAETTSGVMRYVARALACFGHDRIIGLCAPGAGQGVQLPQLLAERGTLYVLGKGSRLGAVAPLLTAFADEVFDVAERQAGVAPGRRLDPPFLGLLDEAPSIAPIPGLPDLLADGRGRGIVMIYALQSFSQAISRWGSEPAETMANATSITAVFGGLTSSRDLGDLERLCGRRRVRRESTHQGGGGAKKDRSTTVSWEDEAVLRADEIRTLPPGVALVLWGKLPPVLADFPLLSERADWAAIEAEERSLRRANDQARARAEAGRRGLATYRQ